MTSGAATAAPASSELAAKPWIDFKGPNFAVSFPTAPQAASDTLDVPGGTIPLHAWQSVEGLTDYIVAEASLPAGLDGASEGILDGAVISILHGTNVSLTAAPRFTIGTYLVQDLTVNATPNSGSARLMVGGGTLWILIGDGSYGQPPGWDRFLKSFAPGGTALPGRTHPVV